MIDIINMFLEPHILAWAPALLETALVDWHKARPVAFFANPANSNVAEWNAGLMIFHKNKYRSAIHITNNSLYNTDRRQVSVEQTNRMNNAWPYDIQQYADNTAYVYCVYCTERAQSENKDRSEVCDDEIWHRRQDCCDICGSCEDCVHK